MCMYDQKFSVCFPEMRPRVRERGGPEDGDRRARGRHLRAQVQDGVLHSGSDGHWDDEEEEKKVQHFPQIFSKIMTHF